MFRIELSEVPPSMNRFNGRGNVWAYRNEKERLTEAVRILSLEEKERRKLRKPYQAAIVEIEYHFQDNRRRDPDNYSGKFLLDGLTKSGIIEDDDFSHITLSLSGKKSSGNPKTVISVTSARQAAHCEHHGFECPFYKSDGNQRIRCEAGVLTLNETKTFSDYTKSYCKDVCGWKTCTLAKALLAQYERMEKHDN